MPAAAGLPSADWRTASDASDGDFRREIASRPGASVQTIRATIVELGKHHVERHEAVTRTVSELAQINEQRPETMRANIETRLSEVMAKAGTSRQAPR
jgi:hypothetical protein